MTLPIIAGLASVPYRLAMLEKSFHSIYPQVEEVYVYLNKYETIPQFLNVAGVKIFRSQDYEDYKDVGKFFALRLVKKGILFTIDDDIVYPPDYVSRMVSHLVSTEYGAVVGVHASQLSSWPKSYFDRHGFDFRKELDSLAPASILGTGTTAFHIENIGLDFTDFLTYGMADVYLAAHLKRKGIPALVVPRPSGWLIGLKQDGSIDDIQPTLYEQTRRNATPHNTIIRTLAPWGESDALATYRALPDSTVLSDSLVYALSIIDIANSGESRVFSKVQRDSSDHAFVKAKPWIEIYANRASRYLIYRDAIRSHPQGEARRVALDGLWMINRFEAIRASRRIVERNPGDARFLLKHAEFCGKYFLVDEAEVYFQRSVRIAGKPGEPKLPEVLFKYVDFLIFFENYKKASSITVTLGQSHGSHPLFNAWMVLICLDRNDIDSATRHLTNLALAPTMRRGSAMQILVALLARSELQRNHEETCLLSVGAIDASSNSVSALIDLLKIAAILGDRSGAVRVWDILFNNYNRYLETHPELTWFYSSTWSDRKDILEGAAEPLFTRGKFITSFSGFKWVASLGNVEPDLGEEPLVSVIMTAFNSADTIDYALESILNQSHTNIELILVDDMSVDGTANLANRWAIDDARVTVVHNTENLGPYASRNIALKRARGDYIAIQDADDVAFPDRLKVQIGSFLPETRAVLGRHLRMTKDGIARLGEDGSIIQHGSMTLLFKQEIVRELGFFAEVRAGGEKEFESRIEHFYGAHALLRIPEVLVCSLSAIGTDSKIHSGSYEMKRELQNFKDSYSKTHSEGFVSL
ncbi:glycosyltransferase [Arthrobacter sp. TMT4-20]